MNRSGMWGLRSFSRYATALIAALLPLAAFAGTDITTYHGDALRTGWNNTEKQLTPRDVGGKGFGLLRTLDLDDQVDAQPLVVSDQPIDGHATVTDVVYVATDNNSVYAFDPATGEQLLHVNLGPPVPQSLLPGKCHNNGSNVGITGTPVIDVANETLYVAAYTLEDNSPVYRIHALSLRTLRDRVPAPIVKAVDNAAQPRPIQFDAATNRQRAGLVLANGNVYATFASFCDLRTTASRGWMLGWRKDTLKPLASRPLIDRKAAGAPAWFLSTIWMSGSAPAADENGRLYVVTGNADPKLPPIGEREMSESVVAVSGDLHLVSEYFTPGNRDKLDEEDLDFGSGGLLLLPDQDGPVRHLAVAAGKEGILYLMDRDHLGGYTPQGPDKVLGKYPIGRCFCAPTYFTGADGVSRIVTSGGDNVVIWKVDNGERPGLVQETETSHIASRQYAFAGDQQTHAPGFMTSVSSNGTADTVIWAVSHPPHQGDPTVTLHAYDARNATELFSHAAGTWPNLIPTPNIVPVVANGKVFVASYRALSIFGLRVPSKNLVSLPLPDGPQVALSPAPKSTQEQTASIGN